MKLFVAVAFLFVLVATTSFLVVRASVDGKAPFRSIHQKQKAIVMLSIDTSNHEETSKLLPQPYFYGGTADRRFSESSISSIMIKFPGRPSFFVENVTRTSENASFKGIVDLTTGSISSYIDDSVAKSRHHPVSFYTNGKKTFIGTALALSIEIVTEKNPSTFNNKKEKKKTSSSTSSLTYILYDVWHAYASTAVREQSGGNVTSVETVLRSNGTLRLENIYSNPSAAAGFYYHSTPQLGPYCLYRKRANETQGVLPDCPNINVTARKHAIMLNAMGVDVVVVDGTNLGNYAPFSDALQLRPMEVLAEEWYRLRTQEGMQTPQIVAWNTLPIGSNLWQYYLNNIYNDARLSTLVAKSTPAQGNKFIFFIPNGDPSVVAQVEANFGRNNVVVLTMWANWAPSQFVNQGAWQFMAPCRDPGNDQYTTSVADLAVCNQLVIPRSLLGTSTTVSPSYQLGYSSLPFQGAGKLNTFTIELQFATAIDAKTDNLVISTFNEFIAQPQTNPYAGQYGAGKAFSMGVGTWDSSFNNDALWVDTYGFSLARDIEPSVEGGSATYNVVASCLRLKELLSFEEENSKMQLKDLCASLRQEDEQEEEELCCSRFKSQATQSRQNIWSLTKIAGNKDYLITNNPTELNDLVASQQWAQLCNPYAGPQSFCVDTSILGGQDAGTVPFLLATLSSDPWLGASPVGLYRCLEGGVLHFFSTDPNCEGQKTEFFLGYAASSRTSEFPRTLRRCYDVSQGGTHYHSLDLPCQHGQQEAIYGYVH